LGPPQAHCVLAPNRTASLIQTVDTGHARGTFEAERDAVVVAVEVVSVAAAAVEVELEAVAML